MRAWICMLLGMAMWLAGCGVGTRDTLIEAGEGYGIGMLDDETGRVVLVKCVRLRLDGEMELVDEAGRKTAWRMKVPADVNGLLVDGDARVRVRDQNSDVPTDIGALGVWRWGDVPTGKNAVTEIGKGVLRRDYEFGVVKDEDRVVLRVEEGVRRERGRGMRR